MIDISFLNQIDRFNLVIKKRVLSQYSGERLSLNTGEGLVFSDYREYIPGDDFRQIDWHLYARTDKHYIKRYEEEKNMAMHVFIDASASMDFGQKTTKYEYASMIGLGFAYLAIKNNEKLDISTFADKIDFIKTKKGENSLLSILDFLNKKKVEGKSNFQESISTLKKRLRSKSLVVIISDFLFNPKELEEALKLLKKSSVYVIQILDAEELKLNMSGDFVLKDSEHGSVVRTYISNRLRSLYKNKLESHNDRLNRICINMGARFMTVTTNTPIFDTFYQVLK
jgi:uncharacterized protein (DUF58 family)